jgi:hypothetical protein
MSEKRPIDRQRDSGLSLQIGAEDETSAISDFYKIGEKRLLIVKAKGIYEVILPDQIDPKRTNPRLTPLQQRVLDYGSDDDFVCRILLTAKALFRENFFEPQFDYVEAFALAFDGLKDIIAMHQLRLDLEKAQDEAWERFQHQQRPDGSIRMPSIPDMEARCEMYMQKANHVVICLEEIAKLFYRDQLRSKWITALTRLVSERYGSQNPFVDFMERASRFLLFINNTRNSVEHPRPDSRMKVTDYSMNEDGAIVVPTVEVLHPEMPLPLNAVTLFMIHITEGLVTTFEEMMAHLSANNVRQFSGMSVGLEEVPMERRANKKVRFGYVTSMGGSFVPFG